jgi:hypothetical protein
MDLDSFLVSLYLLVEDWWKLHRSSESPKIGRPALLSDPEVLTLAILAQWPRFRSERDFWRFASSHLRPTDQLFPRPTAASPGGPFDLGRCTSLVLVVLSAAGVAIGLALQPKSPLSPSAPSKTTSARSLRSRGSLREPG